jgi:hypothetical protein
MNRSHFFFHGFPRPTTQPEHHGSNKSNSQHREYKQRSFPCTRQVGLVNCDPRRRLREDSAEPSVCTHLVGPPGRRPSVQPQAPPLWPWCSSVPVSVSVGGPL